MNMGPEKIFLFEIIEKLKKFHPATWEEAAAEVVNELGWRQGWHLEHVPNDGIERLYDSGRWDALARGMLGTLVDKNWTLQKVIQILAGKQSDYGPRNILRFGVDGLCVRLWDKVARYNNLRYQGEHVNESLDDTMMDIVGYVAITVMFELGWFTLPLAKDVSE